MGFAIYGKKFSEDEQKVVYIYGMSKDNLYGKIEIFKNPLEEESIKYNVINNVGFVSAIIYIILSFYKQNNYFPDNISRQS